MSSYILKRAVAGIAAVAVMVMGMALPTVAAEETTFTIAQVPDTQNEVLRENDPLMPNRYQWLSDNKQSLNLKFIVHSGDVVNWGAVDPVQFTRADAATNILDSSGVPYSYAIGNHDTAAVTTGGSAAPGNTRDNLRNTTAFNQTFPITRFKNVGGVFEAGKVDNMYQTFTAGNKDWLVLTLEMWPRQVAIDWAKQIVSSHPNHNVIVNTHANIDNSGTRPTTGMYGDNGAEVVWQQLISQYPNIRMVLSAHYGPVDGSGGYSYAEATGVHGNKITQVMTAYHASYQNHVRLLNIDTANNTVQSSVYVNLSTHSSYPSGYITDSASNFMVTNMNWVSPGQTPPPPTPVELLPDPGFESGNGGWKAFVVGTLARVSSPVRSGNSALKVTATSTTPNLVGLTQNSVVSDSVAGKQYTGQCYVRPTGPNLNVRIRFLEYTQNYSSNINLGQTIIQNLPQNTWTLVKITGTATASGKRIIPQIYSTNQTTNTGVLIYDDCSVTRN